MIPDALDPQTALPRPLRVLMVSAELAPFARAGGLGDVLQGLSRALGALGVELVVATPYYGISSLESCPVPRRWPEPLRPQVGEVEYEVNVLQTSTSWDVRVLLLDCPQLFDRAGIYGEGLRPFDDNDKRFAVLSAAALHAGQALWDGPPDVLHAHDWHTALSLAYARLSDQPAWQELACVFTFHNLSFQGTFPLSHAAQLSLPEELLVEEAFGQGESLSFLKAGLLLADSVTTVSQTYARDVLTAPHGCGLEPILQARAADLVGITNGIDLDAWDPARDRALAVRYDAHDPSGRHACKLALAAELGLDIATDPPLLGVVSHLTEQKGIDLLLELVPHLIEQGYRLAIVALGDPLLESRLSQAASRWPSRLAFRPVFGSPLARRIYAGADMFVMPSRFEPCGLGQQYAMRYGAVPVVSAVGGLADTVQQVDESSGKGTGFLFTDLSENGLLQAIQRAERARQKPELWARLVRNCMLRDGSWDAAARSYYALYRDLLGATPRLSLPPPPAVRPLAQS